MSVIATAEDVRSAAIKKIHAVLDDVAREHADQSFPMVLRVRLKPKPGIKPTLTQFAAATQNLVASSKARTGSGYTVHLSRRKSREYGEQDFPNRITVDSLGDFCWLTRCGQRVRQTQFVCEKIRERFPPLVDWLLDHARRLDRHAGAIDHLIAVTAALVDRPMPDCYLRELDVPVDTKFIERHESLLKQWLDVLLPAAAIDVNETKFARRYGLRDGRPHHLIRLLDDSLIEPLRFPCSELSLPIRELARLPIGSVRVLIVENRTTLLTLPKLPRTIALGGVGDSVTRLRDIPWLSRCELFYWGDIDVDGFRILANLRRLLPRITSLLMDAGTYHAHHHKTVTGNAKVVSSQATLSDAENKLLQTLGRDNLRIEQEGISSGYAAKVITDLETTSSDFDGSRNDHFA